MFKPNEIEAMPLVLEGYFKDLENRIMEDIVRRIRINSEITSTADLQMQRLSEMGASKKAVRDYIQQALQLSEQGIDDLYSGAIRKGYNADRDLYTATGRDFIPYAENQQLQQLVEAVKKQTNSDIKNITQSMGFAVRQPDGKLTFQPIADYYQKTLDKAVLDITSGSFDYNTVLKRTVQEMTDSGLRWIDYASGHHNRVPVAVRRAVMTGVNQVTAKIAEQNMELLQTEYVEVSWHRGARPSHQVWQGKIYHWKEKSISSPIENVSSNGLTSNNDDGIISTNNIADSKVAEGFTPAESIEEAEKYARDVLGIPYVSYKGCDVETANAWNEGVYDTFRRFPELKKNFGFIGEGHERNRYIEEAVKQYYFDFYRKQSPSAKREILMNVATYYWDEHKRIFDISDNNYGQSISLNMLKQFKYYEYVKCFAGIAVNRDFGYNAEAFKKSLQDELAKKSRPLCCDTIRSVLDHEVGHQLDDLLQISDNPQIKYLFDEYRYIIDALSGYAWENESKRPIREMVAEAWAEYCNNPEPRLIAKTVGELITELYRQRYGGELI